MHTTCLMKCLRETCSRYPNQRRISSSSSPIQRLTFFLFDSHLRKKESTLSNTKNQTHPLLFFFQFRCPSPLISPILRTFLHLHYSSRTSSEFSLKKFDLFLFPQGSVFGGFVENFNIEREVEQHALDLFGS